MSAAAVLPGVRTAATTPLGDVSADGRIDDHRGAAGDVHSATESVAAVHERERGAGIGRVQAVAAGGQVVLDGAPVHRQGAGERADGTSHGGAPGGIDPQNVRAVGAL